MKQGTVSRPKVICLCGSSRFVDHMAVMASTSLDGIRDSLRQWAQDVLEGKE